MSSKSAVLALKITGDAKDGIRALDDADGKAGKFGGTMGKMAAGAGVAIGAIAVLGKAAFDSASNLEQQAGAVDAVFGQGAAKMHEYAAAAATTVGLAKSEYSELAAVLGAQLSNAGFSGDKLTGTVDGLVTKGADLAAQFGGSTADAVSALSSLLKGETDPIEKYGVSIKQSDITARLAAEGHEKLEGAALKNATAAAALALINDQTTSSVGAFARESDTAAGKSAQLGAMFENAKATLGAGLLPIFVKVADFIQTTVAPVFDRLTAAGGPLSQMFAQASAFITGQVVPALSSLFNEFGPKLIPVFESAGRILTTYLIPAFMAIWGVIQQYVIPIFKSVLGPALDGVAALWKKLEEALERNSGKFSGLLEKVKPLLEFLKNTVAPFVGGVLKDVFEKLGGVIGKVVDAIAWVLDKAASVGGWIGKIGGAVFGAPAAGGGVVAAGGGRFGAARGTAGPSLFGAPMGSLFGAGVGPTGAGQGFGGDVVTVNVSGFVGNETQLADAIEAMLDRRRRRVGTMPAFGAYA